MKLYLQNKCVLLIISFMVLLSTDAFGQHTVRGTVTDAVTSETLPGVNIRIKGTSQGTATGSNGGYELDVSSSADTLIFSFVGYQTAEVPINGRAEIDIAMQPQVYTGEEMIVVGYGMQRKTSVTGSISSVGSEELEATPSVTTGDALVGKVQGITARQADARPGSALSLEIRNMGDPLYVIDGVPSSAADFAQLGQHDIANISILKDASAAVYGLRASSGVVLVETKHGQYSTDTEINISGYYGWQNFTRYPQPANAYQYVRGKVYAAQNRGDAVLPYTPEELAQWREGGGDYKSYDYYDIVMDPMIPQYQMNASVSGGSESISYYLAATNLRENALIDDYSFERTNIQANIEGQVSDRLTIGAEISARIENRQQVGVPGLDDYFNPFLSIFSMWPTESPYANDNPNYVNHTHNVNVNPATYTEDITGWVDDIWRQARTNLNASYDFDFGLSLSGTASYAFNTWDFDGFEYTYNAYEYDEETDTYFTQPGWGNQNPWRERRFRYNVDRFYQLQANYAVDLGKHSISALAAYERSDYRGDEMRVHTVPDNNYINLMSFSNQDLLIHDIGKEARAGYVARFNYNYDDKYLVEVLGRYDGSFLFPEGDRWGLFPGASVGWRISEEDFFQDTFGNTITNLKLRASYGRTGSETYMNGAFIVNPFSYVPGYNYYAGSSVFDGTYYTGVEPRGLPVTNLSWITNITKNIGIDISMFEDRLSASFDVFERRREGLPATRDDVLLPVEVGYSLPPENLNQDAIRGMEGSISYSGRINRDVSFRIGANATLSRLRSLSTYNPRFGNSWDRYRSSVEDRWANITWGYQVIGRFQSQEDIDNHPVNVDGQGNRTLLPGDLIYKDVNGDGIINGMDQRPIGYAQGWNPYMSFGLNGSFSYKSISFAYSFAGASMQSYTRDWELRYFFQNNGNSPEYMLTDRWHRADPFDPNSEWISGHYPANRGANYGHSNYAANNWWTSNVRYLRLKNLQIAYTLPTDLVSRVGVKQLQVYAKGSNIFSFDNMKRYQIDPEIAATNGLVYPRQSLYTLGFNLSL